MVILGVLTLDRCWPVWYAVRCWSPARSEYVTAAKAMGVQRVRTIAFKHILPNVVSVILVTLTLDFADLYADRILAELPRLRRSLPASDLGQYAQRRQQRHRHRATTGGSGSLPALFLAITTICINIVGDTLRDVMDPKSNRLISKGGRDMALLEVKNLAYLFQDEKGYRQGCQRRFLLPRARHAPSASSASPVPASLSPP